MFRTRRSIKWCCAVWLALALGVGRLAVAAPDDTDKPPPGGEVQLMFQAEQFDRWIFQGARNGTEARKRIVTLQTMQLESLAAKHALTADQKQKLALAHAADVNRLFDEIELLRLRWHEMEDQNLAGRLWQDIQPLQLRLMGSTRSDSSLFAKMLSTTLTPAQQAAHRQQMADRRNYRYRAAIEVAIATIDSSVAVDQSQREALSRLLQTKSRPPAAFSQYDTYYVLFRLAELPAEELQPLFSEPQWQQLRLILEQGRAMRLMLSQQGLLADVPRPDDNTEPSEPLLAE